MELNLYSFILLFFGLWLFAISIFVAWLFVKHSDLVTIGDLSWKTFETTQELRVKLEGMEKSTHTIHPVPVSDSKLEEQITKMTGVGKEDFEMDLLKAGFSQNSDLDPDELV